MPEKWKRTQYHTDFSICLIVQNPTRCFVKSFSVTENAFTWEIGFWDERDLLRRNKFHCSGIFEKKLWRLAGGYDVSLPFGWEDWDFWYGTHLSNGFARIRITRQTTLVPVRIPEPLFFYRLGEETMHKFCEKNYRICFALLQTSHPDMYSKDVRLEHQVTVS